MTETLITSSVIIAVIIVLRKILRGKISSRIIYALWLIAAIRLLIPSGIAASPVSIMNTFDESIISDVSERPVYIDADSVKADDIALPEENADVRSSGKNTPAYDIRRAARGVCTAVSCILAAWFVTANIIFYNKLRRSRKQIEYDAPLKVYVTDEISTPCVFGLIKPAVYVTEAAARNKKYLYYTVTHELCHYYHGDTFLTVLRYGLLSAYWFDPFVWAAAVLSKQDCECACDEAVISRIGAENRLEYGRTLIEMIPRKTPVMFGVASTSMSAAGNILKKRITLISSDAKHSTAAFVTAFCAAVLTAAVTFTSAEPQTIDLSDDIKADVPAPAHEEKTSSYDISVKAYDHTGAEKAVHYLASPYSDRESYIYITGENDGYIPAAAENISHKEIEFDASALKDLIADSHFSKAEITYFGEELFSRNLTATSSNEELSALKEMLAEIKPVYADDISAGGKYITISFSRENGGFSSVLEVEFVKCGEKTYGKITADDNSALLELILSDTIPSESELLEAYSQSTHSESRYFYADDTELAEFCKNYPGYSDASFGTDLFSENISENLIISGTYPTGYKEEIIGSIALGVPSDGGAQVIGPLLLWQNDGMSLRVIMDAEQPGQPDGTFCGRDAYHTESADNGKYTSELFVSDSAGNIYKAVFESDDTDIGRQTAAKIFGTFHIDTI